MPIDPASLKAEIQAGPLAVTLAPLVAKGDHTGVAATLNDRSKGGTMIRPLPLLVVLQWTASTGVRARLENFVNAQRALLASNQSAAYAACLSIQDSFWGAFGGAGRSFVLTDPAVAAMLDTIVGAGVMTAADKAGLLALATGPASRAEALGGDGASVTHLDVAAAMRS